MRKLSVEGFFYFVAFDNADQTMTESTDILWRPDESFIEESNLSRFKHWLDTHCDLRFKNADDLWRWSTENSKQFWSVIWEYFEILYDGQISEVISSETMPGSRWFEGTSLNYAEHIFRNRNNKNDALIFYNEERCEKISWRDLEHSVSSLRTYLLNANVRKGDRVVAYIPNIPEAIICFLAVNSIGAIWSCCSPDFGVNTVLERFQQIEPTVFIAVDGYRYNTKPYNREQELQRISQGLPTLTRRVLVPYLDENSMIQGFDNWNDIISDSSPPQELEFERVDFNFPIWILYSSGTTGKPKAITHSHGGVLLEHLKYLHLHNDVKPGENFFWFTTTGWMMWNFLQASLLVGATAVLYDGSPGYPNLNVLWKIVEDLPIHHFGTSAPYLTACMKQGVSFSNNELSELRSIGSTGAPLPPEAFDWVYDSISESVWLCSMSGGTDVCTAFVGGHPWKLVQKGKIQSRALGCALKAYDDKGKEVYGSLGEMVIEKPMPSMPVFFWGDDDNKRYTDSYFEKFPGKWCHGDWIKLFEDGSLIIQGRSDATLNRKGIRIGTAEIYSALDALEFIEDSLILNIEKSNGDDFMPLFVMLENNIQLTDDHIRTINAHLKKTCSPRHVPDQIIKVSDIPYTLSGKKMEVPVKKLFMGIPIESSLNKDAVRNPVSIEEFKSLYQNLKSSL